MAAQSAILFRRTRWRLHRFCTPAAEGATWAVQPVALGRITIHRSCQRAQEDAARRSSANTEHRIFTGRNLSDRGRHTNDSVVLAPSNDAW